MWGGEHYGTGSDRSDNGMDEEILMKNADIAMYQAKQAGRARYQLYKEA